MRPPGMDHGTPPLHRRHVLLGGAIALLGWPTLAADVGTRPALPAVTLLDGSRLDLSAPADVARVVVFWASYCPFCLRHNAHVEKLHRLAAGQRLQVLSVSQDTNPALVHPYLQRHGYTFPVTMDSTPMRAALSSSKVIPLTCALDRQGVLREMIPGEMFEEDVLGLIKLAA